MDPETKRPEASRPDYRRWLRGSLFLIALLVIARFVLEVAGVPHAGTRFLASTAAVFLVAIYLGALAPLRGVARTVQLIIPAIVLSAWTQGWVMLMTILTGVFRLEGSHFLGPEELGSWTKLGGHLIGHVIGALVFSVIAFVLMAFVFSLRRWPVTVGPGAVLGALVIMRYWFEAMGLPDTVAAATSSTVAVIICGFYLGGVAPRLPSSRGKHPYIYGLVIGLVWRCWVFLATLMSAIVPFYKTHFFDPSTDQVALRLLQFFLFGVIVEGLIAGLVVGVIAEWIARATRPAPATT